MLTIFGARRRVAHSSFLLSCLSGEEWEGNLLGAIWTEALPTIRRYAFHNILLLAKKTQVPPLRFAPVGMTNLCREFETHHTRVVSLKFVV